MSFKLPSKPYRSRTVNIWKSHLSGGTHKSEWFALIWGKAYEQGLPEVTFPLSRGQIWDVLVERRLSVVGELC